MLLRLQIRFRLLWRLRLRLRLYCNNLVGCVRFTKFCWVEKHTDIIMKPTNSPTQGQPNPSKIRFKVAFEPLFPTANIFLRGLRFIFCRKLTTRNQTQPNSPPNTLMVTYIHGYGYDRDDCYGCDFGFGYCGGFSFDYGRRYACRYVPATRLRLRFRLRVRLRLLRR